MWTPNESWQPSSGRVVWWFLNEGVGAGTNQWTISWGNVFQLSWTLTEMTSFKTHKIEISLGTRLGITYSHNKASRTQIARRPRILTDSHGLVVKAFFYLSVLLRMPKIWYAGNFRFIVITSLVFAIPWKSATGIHDSKQLSIPDTLSRLFSFALYRNISLPKAKFAGVSQNERDDKRKE